MRFSKVRILAALQHHTPESQEALHKMTKIPNFGTRYANMKEAHKKAVLSAALRCECADVVQLLAHAIGITMFQDHTLLQTDDVQAAKTDILQIALEYGLSNALRTGKHLAAIDRVRRDLAQTTWCVHNGWHITFEFVMDAVVRSNYMAYTLAMEHGYDSSCLGVVIQGENSSWLGMIFRLWPPQGTVQQAWSALTSCMEEIEKIENRQLRQLKAAQLWIEKGVPLLLTVWPAWMPIAKPSLEQLQPFGDYNRKMRWRRMRKKLRWYVHVAKWLEGWDEYMHIPGGFVFQRSMAELRQEMGMCMEPTE